MAQWALRRCRGPKASWPIGRDRACFLALSPTSAWCWSRPLRWVAAPDMARLPVPTGNGGLPSHYACVSRVERGSPAFPGLLCFVPCQEAARSQFGDDLEANTASERSHVCASPQSEHDSRWLSVGRSASSSTSIPVGTNRPDLGQTVSTGGIRPILPCQSRTGSFPVRDSFPVYEECKGAPVGRSQTPQGGSQVRIRVCPGSITGGSRAARSAHVI